MPGEGKTLTEAKLAAKQQIEYTLDGPWEPFLLVHNDWRAVVFRRPSQSKMQWEYKILQHDEDSQIIFPSSSNVAKNRDGAVNAAAYHLAQAAGTYDGLEQYLTSGQQNDLETYFFWQAEYAAARARGMSYDEAYVHACRHRGY